MRTNRWRVYLNVFDDYGNYTGYKDVTEDVELDSIGTIDFSLDNTDYNIGIYKNSNFTVTFRNESGKYSDVGGITSMFRYTRQNSKIKVTWQGNDKPLISGFFLGGGDVLCQELTIFEGLLSDSATSMDLAVQELQFTALGFETSLNNANVLFSQVATLNQVFTVSVADPGVFTTGSAHGLSVGDVIQFTATAGIMSTDLKAGTPYFVTKVVDTTNFWASSNFGDIASATGMKITDAGTPTQQIYNLFGMNFSAIMLAILNQSPITNYLAISGGNINVGTDVLCDNATDFINKNVWDAMTDLLLLTNSVLYVQNGALIVAPRTAGASLSYSFHGQSSTTGVENIQDIQNIVNGLARTWNYLYWDLNSITTVEQNTASIAKYGATTKNFTQTYVTNTPNQATILNTLLTEFGLPKQEFDLYTPINFQTIQLFLLNKVNIDFPPQYIPGSMGLPVCGVSVCGEVETPSAVFAFVESATNFYKIEGTSIDPGTDLMCLSMRRI